MKNINPVILRPEGSDLASRVSARNLRFRAEQVVTTEKVVAIDLTGVLSISESFADELFAVLVEQHGLEWFSNNIKLLHQSANSSHILLSIATAIRRRLENQESIAVKATIDGLIAAKKYSNSTNCNYIHN
ncbi:MAG: hypothetical protein CTY16_11790 [Methylobacter sp.]|nr:MAG: hypothetical protein CTY16_11790 [Methylobacter sp.]